MCFYIFGYCSEDIKKSIQAIYVRNCQPFFIVSLEFNASCVSHFVWISTGVPDEAQVVAFCKDKILYNVEKIKYLVDRNNQIRKWVSIMFTRHKAT